MKTKADALCETLEDAIRAAFELRMGPLDAVWEERSALVAAQFSGVTRFQVVYSSTFDVEQGEHRYELVLLVIVADDLVIGSYLWPK